MKFKEPFGRTPTDLDILIRVEDVLKAVRALTSRGFRVVVREPFTVALVRAGFIVDLYIHSSFAWVVYVDGKRLFECCVEEVESRALTRRL